MSAAFELLAPSEIAWRRRVRLVVEVVDAVDGRPVRDGIAVTARGMRGAPIVNASGQFVWLVEPGALPTAVDVDPGRLPYERQSRPVLPPLLPLPPRSPQYNFVRVELPPTPAYAFDVGTTGVRGTLVRSAAESPPVPLPFDPVRLQWMDDNQPPPAWTDAPVTATTDGAGDFVAIVRLGTHQIARTDTQGRMRVRVAAVHAGTTRFSQELPLRPGYVADLGQNLAWDQFVNV